MSLGSDFMMDKAPWVFTRSDGYPLMGRQGARWQLWPVGAGLWALPRWAWDCGQEAPFIPGPCVSASLCCRAEWYLLVPWDRADCYCGRQRQGCRRTACGGAA